MSQAVLFEIGAVGFVVVVTALFLYGFTWFATGRTAMKLALT